MFGQTTTTVVPLSDGADAVLTFGGFGTTVPPFARVFPGPESREATEEFVLPKISRRQMYRLLCTAALTDAWFSEKEREKVVEALRRDAGGREELSVEGVW
jgi:hypothetical protein